MCPVNGIRDLVQWRTGRDWSNEFLYGMGQGGGFAYLRFQSADPPRQVFWGIAGPRQHEYLAGLLAADYEVVENRTFRFSWRKAREAVDTGAPPVIGPLDMYHLHFYPEIYRQRHIPIHYLLLVGYDEASAYVHDTEKADVQAIPLEELQAAWDVNVPGMGKRNRLAVFRIPQDPPPTASLVRKAIADQCQTILHPPVSLVGVPAMEKLAREIAGWPEELGEQVANKCLRQMREFLNSPPDLEGDHLTAGRDLYVAFLREAGSVAEVDLAKAIRLLEETVGVIPRLAAAIAEDRLVDASALVRRIAVGETKAYEELGRVVGFAEGEE
jgi:hypothetical protein